jgi:hypothetical protein
MMPILHLCTNVSDQFAFSSANVVCLERMNTMIYHIVIRLQYNKPSSKTLSETTSFADMFFYVLNIHCHWTTATVQVL